MGQYSTLPDTQIPTPPLRETTRRLMLRSFFTWCLLYVLGWQAFLSMLGMPAFITVGVITGLIFLGLSSSLITQQRPRRFPWRRLPWLALSYVTLAAISVSWSEWPVVTIITSLLMISVTLAAVVIAYALTWRELLGCLAAAMKWIVTLSYAIELWVALVLKHGIYPRGWTAPENGDVTPFMQWVWGNFFHFNERIQGIVGNANVLGMLCSVAIVLFIALALDAVGRKRIMLWVWAALSAFLFVRAESATTIVATVIMIIIVVTALIMRTATTSLGRRKRYIGFFTVAGIFGVIAFVFRNGIYEALDRDPTLTGRTLIWAEVSKRAAEHPILGNGFASPWLPIDPHFDGWIVDNNLNVMHAHSAWLDVYMQLGILGVLLGIGASAALMWRSWFFAVDRPRIDLKADRKYSSLTLVPLAITALLLTLSLTESTPVLANGWMLGVLFAFKMKINPVLCNSSQPCTEPGRSR